MTVVLYIGFAAIALGIVLCAIRVVRGPSLFDRVLALDTITLNFAGAVVLLSLLQGTEAYMDLVLIIALLGALTPVALAAYLEGAIGD